MMARAMVFGWFRVLGLLLAASLSSVDGDRRREHVDQGPRQARVWGVPNKAEKHAIELDLECASYRDFDWLHVKRSLWRFFDELETQSRNLTLIQEILLLAKSKPQTDCYIGLFCLGLFTFLFMEPANRARSVVLSNFLSGEFAKAIPLTFWDTIAAGWPVFTLLELLSVSFSQDYRIDNVRVDAGGLWAQNIVGGTEFGPADEYEKMTKFRRVAEQPAGASGGAHHAGEEQRARIGVVGPRLGGPSRPSAPDAVVKDVENEGLLALLTATYRGVATEEGGTGRESGKDSAIPTSRWVGMVEWFRAYGAGHESETTKGDELRLLSTAKSLDALSAEEGVYDRYAAASSYFVLAEKVLAKLRSLLQEDALSLYQQHSRSSTLEDEKMMMEMDKASVNISSTVGFKNRKFTTSSNIATSSTEASRNNSIRRAGNAAVRAKQFLPLPGNGGPRAAASRRNGTGVGAKGNDQRTLISAEYFPLWRLLANVEKTGAVTRNYSKLLPSYRVDALARMQGGGEGLSPAADRDLSQHQLYHVALSGNQEQVPGMVATFESLVRNSKKAAHQLVLHFFLAKEEMPVFLNVLGCSFSGSLQLLLPKRNVISSAGTTIAPANASELAPVAAMRDLLVAGGALQLQHLHPQEHNGSQHQLPLPTFLDENFDSFRLGDIRQLAGFLTDYSRITEVLAEFGTFLLHGAARLKIHLFQAGELLEYVSDAAHSSNHGNLTAPHNYVRFSLARRLGRVFLAGGTGGGGTSTGGTTGSPRISVDRVLYLDVDLVVAGDIRELFEELETRNFAQFPVAAIPRPIPLSTFLYTWDQQKAAEWQPIFSTPSFNAGVMAFNLDLFRELGLEETLLNEVFRPANENGRFWRLGSQPPMLTWFLDSWCMAGGVQRTERRVLFLPSGWNVEGLGHHCQTSLFDKNQCLVEMDRKVANGKILHWTGPNKPWIKVEAKDDFNEKWNPVNGAVEPNKDGDANANHEKWRQIWLKYARHCWH